MVKKKPTIYDQVYLIRDNLVRMKEKSSSGKGRKFE